MRTRLPILLRRHGALAIAAGAALLVMLLLATFVFRGNHPTLAGAVRSNSALSLVLRRAEGLVHGTPIAGGTYPEVWIRDLNTFVQLDLETGGSAGEIRKALLVFVASQSSEGGIPDAYTIASTLGTGRRATGPSPTTRLHILKNTVESDQETSLVQAVFKYVEATGDRSILDVPVAGQSVVERLGRALTSLMTTRLAPKYGLLWSGATVDWGDVQMAQPQATQLVPTSVRAVGIYANAMLSIAVRDFISLPGLPRSVVAAWSQKRSLLDQNIRRWLWDPAAQKYRAHIYLGPSPLSSTFDEQRVYLEGGTAVAIEAGLLTPKEISTSLTHMDADVRLAHAGSIGLNAYPPYPSSAFPCCSSGRYSMLPYAYQNGGDWDWFGGRMVQDLITAGMYRDAYRELIPMLARVEQTGGFYEWWTRSGVARGSSSYRGSAGELGLAALQLLEWARHTS